MLWKFTMAAIFVLTVASAAGYKTVTSIGAYTLNGGTAAITSQTYTTNTTDISDLKDLNGDGKVDILDIFIVSNAFGSQPGDSNWNPTADVNKDGVIDVLDIRLVAEDYGKGVDQLSPAFGQITANSTMAGRPVQLTCVVNSDLNVSSYVYSWNNTGTWQNQSTVFFSDFINSTEANAIHEGTWNSTGGDTVSVIVYANDTDSNWAQSTQFNFTLTTFSSSVVASQNWAGYVTVSDTQNPEPIVTEVSASWTVPSVTLSQGATYSAVWIGIGGFSGSDHTLIQAGTMQDCVRGRTSYSAWYELLPNYVITINLSIRAGDQVNASILLIDSSLNRWLISIADLTTGQQYQKYVVYDSSQLSAEWIVERPMVGGRIANLADFGNVTFASCQTTLGATAGTISDFSNITVAMYQNIIHGSGVTELTSVSELSNDGSSFNVRTTNS
jgi:hypothetical protein